VLNSGHPLGRVDSHGWHADCCPHRRLAEVTEEETEMGHLVVVSVGEYGGTLPLLFIGQALRERGHRVDVVTHWEFEKSVRNAGLAFSPACDRALNERLLEDTLLTEPTGKSPEEYLVGIDTYFSRYFRPVNATIYGHLETLIGSDTVMLSDDHPFLLADTLARLRLGTPLLRSFQEPPGTELYRLIASSDFRALAQPRLEELYEGLLSDLGLPHAASSPLEDWSLPKWYQRLGIECLGLWPSWYEQAPFPDGFFLGGFLPIGASQAGELSPRLEEALRDPLPPVLFVAGTIGTTAEWEHTFFEESVQACRDLGRRPILVSGRRGVIPDVSSADALAFDFIPIARIASRVAAVVHHGGMNGCVNILAQGTPQITVPRVYGQQDNADRFERLGVSRSLPPDRYRRDTLRSALGEILSNPWLARRCRELAVALHSDNGPGRIFGWVESRVAELTSHIAADGHRSPAIQA
jgi:rhamnosyltransferase subunit B